MPIVSMKNMLQTAREGRYAVGQFNVNSLEFAQAFLLAAEEESSPVILGVTEAAVRHLGGYALIAASVRELIKEYEVTVPVALHLDHSSSFEACARAIHAGFSSVMIDGSHLPLSDNIAITSKVVAVAHALGVSVEAEIGRITGEEDGIVVEESLGTFASAKDCGHFILETQVDCLAPALGSVHGRYKGEPQLQFDLLADIVRLTDVPCALHGGTGIPTDAIRKAISLGICKINVNTENQMLYTKVLRNTLAEEADLYEVQRYSRQARDAVKAGVKQKMREFGSSHQV